MRKKILFLFLLIGFISCSSAAINIDYPTQYVIFQRHNATTGEIIVRGTYSGGTPTSIEAKFNNDDWAILDNSPANEKFYGIINASVGNGTLYVKYSNDPLTNSSVNNIGVGDLIAISGQSNAEGRANTKYNLSASNQFMATVHLQNNTWKMANDPVDTGSSNGSAYPLLANYLVQNLSIPIGFISAAEGGYPLSYFRRGNGGYAILNNSINRATNGTRKIKTIIFYQGETDAQASAGVNGSYDAYKGNLSLMASEFLSDFNVSSGKIVVTQIDFISSDYNANRSSLDNIRKAQQDSWLENSNITQGAITYDINLGDDLHFRTDAEVNELARRWWMALSSSIYGVEDNNGTRLIRNISLTTNSTNSFLNMAFDKPLFISYWNGTNSSKAMGWRIVDGDNVYNDGNITSTVISGNNLTITINGIISNNSLVYLGSWNDAYGVPVIRGNSTASFPALMIFGNSVVYSQDSPRQRADVNNDSVINVGDYTSIRGKIGNYNCNSSNNWCERADANRDSIVNPSDYTFVRSWIGK